ncbi:MAG: hypothetical protein L6V93_11730 [Clostridiales bacterium]|nr:MAG: hypothetical protein L6V93_11730 [Clostridiales bacterium]
MKEFFGDSVLYSEQKEMLGTGHAVMMTKPHFEGENTTVMVLCGDAPLISEKLIRSVVDFHKKSGASATVVSAKIDNPFGYGRVITDKKRRAFEDC